MGKFEQHFHLETKSRKYLGAGGAVLDDIIFSEVIHIYLLNDNDFSVFQCGMHNSSNAFATNQHDINSDLVLRIVMAQKYVDIYSQTSGW